MKYVAVTYVGSGRALPDPGHPTHVTSLGLFPPAPSLGRRHTLSLRSKPPQLILCHDRPTVPPCKLCRCRGWLPMMETLGGCGTMCIGEASNIGTSCGGAGRWQTRPRHKSHDEDNQDHGGCQKSPLGHPPGIPPIIQRLLCL